MTLTLTFSYKKIAKYPSVSTDVQECVLRLIFAKLLRYLSNLSLMEIQGMGYEVLFRCNPAIRVMSFGFWFSMCVCMIHQWSHTDNKPL